MDLVPLHFFKRLTTAEFWEENMRGEESTRGPAAAGATYTGLPNEPFPEFIRPTDTPPSEYLESQPFEDILRMATAEKRAIDRFTAKTLYEKPSDICECCVDWVEERPTDIKPSVEKSADTLAHCLVLRYAQPHKGETTFQLHSIVVQDEALKEVVREALKNYPGIDISVKDLEFKAPFRPLFFRWKELMKVRDTKSDRNDCDEVKLANVLIDVLQPEFEKDLRASQDLLDHGNMTTALMWTLFPPGTVVSAVLDGSKQVFLVSYVSRRGRSLFRPGYTLLELSYLDFDGSSFGWRLHTATIDDFDGVKPISDLPVAPLALSLANTNVIERHTITGRRVLDLCGGAYKAYNGAVRLTTMRTKTFAFDVDDEDRDHPDPVITKVAVDGRIVVDHLGYQKHAFGAAIKVERYPSDLRLMVPESVDDAGEFSLEGIGSPKSYDKDSLSEDNYTDDLQDSVRLDYQVSGGTAISNAKRFQTSLLQHSWTKQQYGIPPEAFVRPIVRGYCLTSKSWATFDVQHVREIHWNEHAFDKLVMVPARKRLLESLVEEQRHHKKEFDDIVRGKGQGLIVLLYGPPGTGKTLTAESIADRLRMPLYALAASELGSHPEDIEEELARVLKLAASWNSVLLLDEADAFLEKRTDNIDSQERNKRVASKTIMCVSIF